MEDTYRSIEKPSQGIYKEKGSKFLSFAYPVTNEEEIQDLIHQLKKQYHDARHHCYAYILGKDMKNFRSNDDGEPNHSAGDPILGQIKSNELTQILIVVVRYFGGTKLGVGGLIRAYKTAAAEAIASSEIVEKTVMVPIEFSFGYLSMDEIMRTVKKYDLKIISQEFDNSCRIKVACRESLAEEVIGVLSEVPTSSQIK
ncbi:YigZ family protein [uncultured Cyclobacterium sp.]|uniref:IMPACT family protein n=1 Tax=uncultured Cyclobacterium sp. TaxID=453820 RepID=UPI0030EEB4DE